MLIGTKLRVQEIKGTKWKPRKTRIQRQMMLRVDVQAELDFKLDISVKPGDTILGILVWIAFWLICFTQQPSIGFFMNIEVIYLYHHPAHTHKNPKLCFFFSNFSSTLYLYFSLSLPYYL